MLFLLVQKMKSETRKILILEAARSSQLRRQGRGEGREGGQARPKHRECRGVAEQKVKRS